MAIAAGGARRFEGGASRKQATMTRHLKDPWRLMTCENCQRTLDFRDFPGHPPKDADPGILHPIVRPNAPAYSVLCSCGHYTYYVVTPRHDSPGGK
jgi:hypothetical protein